MIYESELLVVDLSFGMTKKFELKRESKQIL